jgi:TonB-linked SusC/RagA family outer membrane protein
MYKFYFKSKAKPPGFAAKFLLMMKLTPLILITAILQVSASSFAQQITLSERNAPLIQVFEKISKQTGYDFLVSSDMLKQANPVTIVAINEDIKRVLDKIFAGQPLNYSLQEKMVVVSKKEPPIMRNPTGSVILPVNVLGKVTDTTGTPLAGATIKATSQEQVVLTKTDGTFSISAQTEDEIIVSYIGYNSYTFKATSNASFQNITLHAASSKLEEVNVVSTGYQSLPKERATGSFAQPNKDMFENRVSTDVLSKLSGITSGLLFNANTSASQSGKLDISIRGRSTIFANDQPLIIVDNFPYSGDINNLNPNDVENITVLKDAAAASIWGVRAGNGVVVITTKKGKLNQQLKISLNANVTVFQKPALQYNPQYMSSSDYIGVETFLFNNGKYDGDLSNTTSYPFLSPVVTLLAQQRAGTLSSADATAQINRLAGNNVLRDISRYLYQDAVNQQYALNLSGGDAKTSYYFSTGYDNNLPMQKANGYDRLTINSNIIFAPIKNLQIGVGLNYMQSNTTTDNTISQVLSGNIYPYAQLAGAKGNPLSITRNFNPAFIQAATSSGYLDWSYSPLKDLGLGDNHSKYNDIRIAPAISYHIIKGLSVDGKYQYEQYTSNNRDYESQQTFYTRNQINQYAIVDNNGMVTGYNIPPGGILNQSLTTVTAYNARGQLTYSGEWAKNSLHAIAGIEQSQTKSDGTVNSTLYGYNNEVGTYANVDFLTTFALNPQYGFANIPNAANMTGTVDRLRSYFGNAAYTYNNRYTFSWSARIDESNYFGVATNLKSVPLWSMGAKWDINKASFYHADWLPVLNLRATYGYNGNLNKNITGITTLIYTGQNSTYTGLNQNYIANVGNPELRWEKAGIANLALDFGLKDNRLSGSIEYYIKNGKDIIGNESVAPSTGLTTFSGNYASMKGKGIDIQLTSRNLNSALTWTTTFLFSYATDKVTKYNAPIIPSALTTADGASGNTYPIAGYPVYGLWSYRWAGLDAANGDPQGYINGKLSKSFATLINPGSTNELIFNGPARPQYFGGLNNRFAYRNFSISFNLSYKFGYYFRKSALNYSGLYNNWLGGNQEFVNRWQKPGDEKTTNVPSMLYPANQGRDLFYQYSSATVVKGDHVRLQDISLSYNFDKKHFRDLPFNNIQLYVYANDLGIIWRANQLHLDPDYPTGYPSPKTISLGLKTNF